MRGYACRLQALISVVKPSIWRTSRYLRSAVKLLITRTISNYIRRSRSTRMSKTYSIEEVKAHNTPESLWIIIDNRVFDVTEWQKDHPGGKKMLQKVGGKDATRMFKKYHDTETVMRKFGEKFLIGELANEDSGPAIPLKTNATNASDGTPLPMYGDMIPYADPLWYQGFHSDHHNETHEAFRDCTREYIDKNIAPFVDQWEEAGEIPEHVYRDFGEAGYLSIMAAKSGFPVEYAENKFEDIVPADKVDPWHTHIVGDELCRVGSGSLVWFLCGGFGIGLPPIMKHARADIRKRVIPGILRGEKRVCLAITEPSGGSDVANLETSAVLTPDGKHYIVNGVKKWITNGIWADYMSVAVRTGPKGMKGISMLLIEKTMPGVTTRRIKTQGMRASGSTFVEFDDVKVPVENLLGEENEGFKVIMGNFNEERMGVCTQAVRFSRVCYEEAVKWAHERETFGVKLIKHAVIRNKLAQMACRIEGCAALFDTLLLQFARMDDEEAMFRLGGHIAGLKALCTQTFEFCAREASQIFGGLAYTVGGRGGKVERLYRDVRALAIPGGSEEIMLDLSIRQSLKVHQFLGAKL